VHGSTHDVLTELERWGAGREWVGPDPYEGLNTAAGRMARSQRPRQAAIQAYKRVPFAPPWPLSAPQRENSKALALALAGYSTVTGRSLPGASRFLDELPGRIRRLNLLFDGAAWGYHFDVQTRHLFYDRRTPNAIATYFVVDALLEASAALPERGPELRSLAVSARPFLLSLLADSEHGAFFAYVAAGSELVHNANMLVCGALCRIQELDADPSAEAAVRTAAATSIACQRSDGLWDYGEASNLRWVDNFHTAYVLEGLARVEAVLGMGSDQLQRGVDAWRERLFEPGGWARYFPEQRFPLEPHSCASAIDLACLLADRSTGSEREQWIAFADEVARSAIRELWLGEQGRFAYRRTARGLNRREFMRWTNAPMFRSLARLVSAR
jgi:polysaccharide biosynthesis protein VpsJ